MLIRPATLPPLRRPRRPAPGATLLLAGLLLSWLLPPAARPWGGAVHRVINRNAMANLPADFEGFAQWTDQVVALASAADERKDAVPDEGIRHYIDIDDYAEFHAGSFPRDWGQAVAKYGIVRLKSNGIGPWALAESYDQLVADFAARNWSAAVATAADIGHYCGDLHQPLHLTRNYDGDDTGQSGIHSRFESRLTSRHMEVFTPLPGHAARIESPIERTFAWIDETWPGVARILAADRGARTQAGGSTSSELYYDALWEQVGQETWYWVATASMDLAGLWYSAWLEAGAPTLPGTVPVAPTTWSRIKLLAEP